MATADDVRAWVQALRSEFPYFENEDCAATAWLNNAAITLRTDRWLEPVRQSSLDPMRRDGLLAAWLASIAEHLGVPADDVLPTMGTHMTMERVVSLLDLRGPGRYLISPDAHAAVMNALETQYLKGRAEIVPLELDAQGRIDLGQLEELLTPRVRAAILTHVSSMTGTIQEIGAAGALVRDLRERTEAATILVVDGAQSVPRMPVDASAADVYTLSAHKVGGFPGAVVAVSEAGRRAMSPFAETPEEAEVFVRTHLAGGSVHVEAIGALAAALEHLDGLPALDDHTGKGMESVAAAIGLLRDRLLGRLREIPKVEILFEPEDPTENAGIVSFLVEGKTAAEVDEALIARDIRVRAATRDERGHYFHVPLATHVLPRLETTGGALRASPWITNVPEDVDRLAEALGDQ